MGGGKSGGGGELPDYSQLIRDQAWYNRNTQIGPNGGLIWNDDRTAAQQILSPQARAGNDLRNTMQNFALGQMMGGFMGVTPDMMAKGMGNPFATSDATNPGSDYGDDTGSDDGDTGGQGGGDGGIHHGDRGDPDDPGGDDEVIDPVTGSRHRRGGNRMPRTTPGYGGGDRGPVIRNSRSQNTGGGSGSAQTYEEFVAEIEGMPFSMPIPTEEYWLENIAGGGDTVSDKSNDVFNQDTGDGDDSGGGGGGGGDGTTGYPGGGDFDMSMVPESWGTPIDPGQFLGGPFEGYGYGDQGFLQSLIEGGKNPGSEYDLGLDSLGGDTSAMEDAIFKRSMGLIDPAFNMGRERELESLANRGVVEGSDIYGERMGTMDRQYGEARQKSALDAVISSFGESRAQRTQSLTERLAQAGQYAQAKQFGLGAQQNLFGQQMNERSMGFGELSTLLGFGGGGQGMNYSLGSPVDVIGASGAAANNQMTNYQMSPLAGFLDLLGAGLGSVSYG